MRTEVLLADTAVEKAHDASGAGELLLPSLRTTGEMAVGQQALRKEKGAGSGLHSADDDGEEKTEPHLDQTLIDEYYREDELGDLMPRGATQRARMRQLCMEKLTGTELRAAQAQDVHVGMVKRALTRGNNEELWMRGDRKWKARMKRHLFTLRDGIVVVEETGAVVLPVRLRQFALSLVHNTEGKHLHARGMRRELIALGYWWPGMATDCDEFTSLCRVCRRMNRARTRAVGVAALFSAVVPFAVINVDLMGRLPPTDRGYRYILTVQDRMTRLVRAFPLRRADDLEVARTLLNEWCLVYGFPRAVLSDRGSQFVGAIASLWQRWTGVRRLLTTTYRPSTNGMVERTHQDIAKGLATLGLDLDA